MKPGWIRSLERLYKRRFPSDRAYSLDQAREIALLSRCINRQIGFLIDRRGKIDKVIVGDANGLIIPELPPVSGRRPRGLRLFHTHLGSSPLNQEDLTDMLFLRLDGALVLTVSESGEPRQWQWASLAADSSDNPYLISPLLPWHDCSCDLVERLETENITARVSENGSRRAFLVSVSSEPRFVQERNLKELGELAKTAGLEVAGEICQRVQTPHPAHILGKGKLAELEILALNADAEILIFDGELNPAQLNNLAEITRRKVLDRTQLILDIFAGRASSKAGKLQAELAQLAYNQPRLAGRHKALDRLMGGVGGRGPGESKLETDRRKIRERMTFLKRELEKIRKRRASARAARERNGIPVCSLVGYTNAGKSTLLNILTSSSIYTADLHFATLDPTTRRLRFPRERSIVLSDTVGFVRNLPRELIDAFRATLEELDVADLLLLVADAADDEAFLRIEAVKATLEELSLDRKKTILVFNKVDLLSREQRGALSEEFPDAVFVSAKSGESLEILLNRIEAELFGKEDGHE